ncbi:MAG: flagellar protein FlaG [Lachnospiraceae bacterium]|jgi:flagellar protein FlaG|nr:flagellar protein FlaG [Lachnospiraceae bacterium]
MAIEPISSAMTFQAQPYQPAQEVKLEKPAEEYTDSTAQEQYQVDNKTVVVDSTASADEEGSSQQQGQQPQEQPSLDQIRKAVDDLNKKMSNSEAIFGIHDKTNRVTIKIVDKKTKEVIKELPPEKTLDMIAKVWEMAGIMVDEKR